MTLAAIAMPQNGTVWQRGNAPWLARGNVAGVGIAVMQRAIWAIGVVLVIAAGMVTLAPARIERQHTVIFGDSLVKGLSSDLLQTEIVNQSVSGSLTPQIAEIVSNYRQVTKFAEAREVILQGGVNDLLSSSPFSIAPSYRKMIAEIPDTMPILIVGILPFDQGRIRINPSTATAANLEIAAICSQRRGCSFVEPFGNSISPEMLSDGLHLSVAGLKSLAAKIHSHLQFERQS